MSSKNKKLNKFRHDYTVKIDSHPQDSWVVATVTDRKNNRTATAEFHLFIKNKLAYAEVAIEKSRLSELEWIAQNIDAISPVVSEAVLNAAQVIIFSE